MLFPDVLTIDILQKDIDAAKAHSERYRNHEINSYSRANSCPVAQSIRRTYPEVELATVGPWGITLESGDFFANYEVSDKLKVFIEAADKHEGWMTLPTDNVEPVTVEVQLRNIKAKRDYEIFARAPNTK